MEVAERTEDGDGNLEEKEIVRTKRSEQISEIWEDRAKYEGGGT